jgi:murein DD-endopeptidase MepM/ murein hydrolase activator NlpD
LNPLLKQIQRILGRARRRYSVMVMSGPDGPLRQFSLPGLLVPLGVGIALLGVLGGGAAILSWASHRVERANVAVLETENRRLASQLEEIRETVESFERKMAENLDREQVYRNLANLDPIPAEVQRLGIGGPPPFSELEDEASPSPLVREAREMLNRLDELNRRAQFQGSNLEETVATLKETREELERIPSISPVRQGWFASGYGTRSDPFTGKATMHRGLDFSAWTGTPVYATADGKIVTAGRHRTLGLLVEVDHGNGIETRYGHNSRLLVKVGQTIKRGELIAEVGSTGRSTSPHCHYEVHIKGRHVNPWRYILDGGPQRNSEA